MPPISCYAVQFPAFQPAMRIITAISQTNPAIVTTSFSHQYTDGLIVRLDIPLANGMQQISGITYPISVTGLAAFSVPVDATSFDAYVDNECCCVLPIGQNSDILINATRNVLPY